MAGLTEAQKVAFSKWMQDTLTVNKAEIERLALEKKKVKFDTDGYIKTMQENDKNYEGAEGDIVKANTALKNANKIANEKLDVVYKYASDSVEAVIGAIGKDEKLSGILRNKRDSMANEAARGPENPANPA